MRSVTVTGTAPGRTAAELYPIIRDFPRFPELTDVVVSVDPLDLGEGRSGCAWLVKFRRGLLRWTEEEHFDHERHRIEFDLIDGDLDRLTGRWALTDDGPDCRVEFFCEFDMGIPTLAHVIEPIAEETLRDHVMLILRALIGTVEFDQRPTTPVAAP